MVEKKPTYSGLEFIAGELKNARTRKNLTLDEVSERLMVQKKYLENIEEGNLQFLPKAYIYTFVRKYACEMGLADENILERCRRELLIETAPVKMKFAHPAEARSTNDPGVRADMAGAAISVSSVRPYSFFIFMAALTSIACFLLTAFF
ncbi:MAG: hypothetical protein HGA70_07410 [Chlorobiaceae bacterium]|nr:hypothetical protein [Chlorobiaceae bacterium]